VLQTKIHILLGSIFLLLLLFLLVLLNERNVFASPNVLDINALERMGVNQSTIEDIVISSLEPRARPPMDSDFINLLASYGGDPLTRAYLDMDKETSNLPVAPISQNAVKRMIERKVTRDVVIASINEALRTSNNSENQKPIAPAAGDRGIIETDIPGDYNNTGPVVGAVALGTAPLVAGTAMGSSGGGALNAGTAAGMPNSTYGSVPNSDTIIENRTTIESIPSDKAPQNPAVGYNDSTIPSTDEAFSQNAYDGYMKASLVDTQMESLAIEHAGAGLASESFSSSNGQVTLPKGNAYNNEEAKNNKQALEEVEKKATFTTPYPVREPAPEQTFYMGSYEKETLDAHKVDVHRNSQSGYLGTSVESTPRGHKVHRFFSGKTDSTVEGQRGSDAPKQRSSLGGTPTTLQDFLP
jgi:hypothetical protein